MFWVKYGFLIWLVLVIRRLNSWCSLTHFCQTDHKWLFTWHDFCDNFYEVFIVEDQNYSMKTGNPRRLEGKLGLSANLMVYGYSTRVCSLTFFGQSVQEIAKVWHDDCYKSDGCISGNHKDNGLKQMELKNHVCEVKYEGCKKVFDIVLMNSLTFKCQIAILHRYTVFCDRFASDIAWFVIVAHYCVDGMACNCLG